MASTSPTTNSVTANVAVPPLATQPSPQTIAVTLQTPTQPPADIITSDHLLSLLTIVVAAWGVWTAQRGVRTWRDQLHGQYTFELARKIAKGAFYLRNLAKFMHQNGGFNESNVLVRMNIFLGAASELEMAALEGEMLWGREVPEAVAAMTRTCGEFLTFAMANADKKSEAEMQEVAKMLDAPTENVVRIVRPHLPKQ